ncbi:MAG: hypothetical protein IIZ67_05550 [Bacilli bacterium]|nr:hypothetical protein [Bacilli bacterium]
MSEEEFFKRLLNKITKEFGYDVASTLELMFMTKEKKVEQLEKEIERLNNIIDEFEDWLGKQRIRNCEWDNFVIKDARLGIPITYLLNKLKELKEE